MSETSRVVDFLFEAGMLARTPRTGYALLGSGAQSVAEHSHRVALTGYALAQLDGAADADRVLRLCLFHDLPETRTAELNHVHQRYVTADVHQAVTDMTTGLPFAEEVKQLVQEYEAGETAEARIAQDADRLELILCLKELMAAGNKRAEAWITRALDRLHTDRARQVAHAILLSDPARWAEGQENPYASR